MVFLSLFICFRGKNLSTFVYMAATVYYIGCDILVDNLTSPSWSLRIMKEVLELELDELCFDFGLATNSLNEHPRADLPLHIRWVSMQVASESPSISPIFFLSKACQNECGICGE